MGKRLDENLGYTGYDNLIVELDPPVRVMRVDLAAGMGVVKRGTVLGGPHPAGGWFMLNIDTQHLGQYVLAEDVDTGTGGIGTGTVSGLAYCSGHFNRSALIIADNLTLDETAIAKLAENNIFVSDAVELK